MGVTGNGDYLSWVAQPSDKPDAWDVAVNQALRAPWYTFTGRLKRMTAQASSRPRRAPLVIKATAQAHQSSPCMP